MKPAKILLAILAVVTLASAQTPPMPKPGPEHAKLEYFAGTWTMEGDLKPSPWGPGGKFTGSDHNEWMSGNFFMVSHSDVHMPMGDAKGIAIFGYNTDENQYTYHAFNSMGEAESATGKLDGDNWLWTSHEKMGGHVISGRYSIKVASPTAYTFRFEMQPEGGDWATIMEGKATKSK